jgi:tetratricopeptide (TPR) repeat protein
MRAPFILFSLLATTCFAATFDEAKLMIEKGDARTALPIIEEALKANPTDAGIHFWLGRARLGSGEPKLAEASFKEAVRIDPQSAEAHAWLGNTYGNLASNAGMLSAMGLASKMRSAWDAALKIDPDNLAARTGYLQFYLAAPGIAGGSVEKAREQVPFIRVKDAYLANLLEAQIERRDGTAERAESLLRGCIELLPARREAWLGLVDLLVKENRADEAFVLLDEFAKQPGGPELAPFFLGRTAALSGKRLEEGEAGLRAYIAAPSKADDAPSAAAARARLGQVLVHKGDVAGAREAFEAALAEDPKSRVASEGLKALSPAKKRNS